AAFEQQVFAVACPVEVEDEARREFCELVGSAASDGLLPNVRRAVAGQSILQSFSRRRPTRTERVNWRLGDKLKTPSGYRYNRKFVFWNRLTFLIANGELFAIGGHRHGAYVARR